MESQLSFQVDNTWRLVVKDLGFDEHELLRRAELPGDLFSRENYRLEYRSYFRLFDMLVEMAGERNLALEIGRNISLEMFNPPIFAAMCSPNLNKAAERLSRFKKLIGPMKLVVQQERNQTSISYEFDPVIQYVPPTLLEFELVFLVQLTRLATRDEIRPSRVLITHDIRYPEQFREYFGVSVEKGNSNTVIFSSEVAERPFLTSNEGMWNFFEPELKRRLYELDRTASTSERVQSSLVELIPSGEASIGSVAKSLQVSTRTLQRRLQKEGTNFQTLLNDSREQLARHYLKSSSLSGMEISFLLGFDEPSSFYRAFQSWTGQTPESVRTAYQV